VSSFLKKEWLTPHVFTEHADIVMCLRVAEGGKKLVTGSKDKTVRMWDTNTGECLMTYIGTISVLIF
jgi:WD40 repeat protein